jgi:hypothetical protein
MENKKKKDSIDLYYKVNKITDKVYLGDEEGARDKKLLNGYGITHILVCGRDLKKRFKDEFVYHRIEIDDSSREDILEYFEEAFQFIENSKAVYLHCIAGKSRSPTFAIGYLMWKNKLSYKEASDLVKKKRKGIELNEGFEQQLLEFEKILKDYGNSFTFSKLRNSDE